MTTKPLGITEELIHYIRAMQPEEPEILKRLGRETDAYPQAGMRIGWDEGRFLMLLVTLVQARRTIEIGVFTGYSALCTALALPEDGRMVACDISEPWTDVARRYWREAGVDRKIDLRLAPALATLEGLLGAGPPEAFDMAFIDADKVNYWKYFEHCLELVRPGGVIAVDNTLWYGRVIDPAAVDADTEAIRAFNERLREDARVDACLTAVGDGLTLAVKKRASRMCQGRSPGREKGAGKEESVEYTHLRDVVFGRIGFMEWVKAVIAQHAGLQLAVCVAAIVLAGVLTRSLCPRLARLSANRPHVREWVNRRLPGLLIPLLSALFIHVALKVSAGWGWPSTVIGLVSRFVGAWLVIQLFASILLPPGWTKAVATAVIAVFLLDGLGLLDPVIEYMNALALTFQNGRLSMLEVVKAVLLLAVMLPLSNKLCLLLEAALWRMKEVKPQVRVLVAKLTKATLYTLAIISALDLVGINLQMLAVFSGAVGLGVGFGLQKVVSNLVSGVVLLLDNSVKPGDVIEVSGIHGRVEAMNARFVNMLTRDGKSFLIPNDDFISNKVVNWHYTGPSVRLDIPVEIAYASDLKKAMELMAGACAGKERVLDQPEPVVLLKAFGDNGLLLELRTWMMQPELGVNNLISEIQLTIWEEFTKNGIEFPFPQRDVRVKAPVTVEFLKPGEKPEGG